MKLNIGRNRKNSLMPWYDYLWTLVAGAVALQIIDWVSGAGVLLTMAAAMAGGFTAGYLARYLAIRLGKRFPALKSKHVGYYQMPMGPSEGSAAPETTDR